MVAKFKHNATGNRQARATHAHTHATQYTKVSPHALDLPNTLSGLRTKVDTNRGLVGISSQCDLHPGMYDKKTVCVSSNSVQK